MSNHDQSAAGAGGANGRELTALGVRTGLVELAGLLEVAVVVVFTWFALGELLLGYTLGQKDESLLVAPLMRSAIAAGPDWTEHLYRIGVLGGSKMHEFTGTTPIMQVCAALGLSATVAANLAFVFLQLALGYFGLAIARGVRASTAPWPLALRIATVWACAFAPVLGWRVGVGHGNLIQGLTPYLAVAGTLLAARQGTLGPVTIVMATFTVWNGVTGLGSQTVLYGAVFGLPIVAGIALDGPPRARWRREHWCGAGALLSGVLLALPQLSPMIAHATGPDATRGLGEHVIYSYGAPRLLDLVESLPWFPELAARGGSLELLHERNYPLGPWLCFVPLLWWQRQRWLLAGMMLSAALATVIALDVAPLSRMLVAAIPPLEAFRVPARAMLPLAIIVPAIAFGALLRHLEVRPASEHGGNRRLPVLALLVAVLVVVARSALPHVACELAAWAGGLALLVLVRRPRVDPRYVHALLLIVTSIGLIAFDARLITHLPREPIERGPARLRDAALTSAPELADPLYRVKLVNSPAPYFISLGFAAGLSTLDGIWYPPRRFIALLALLEGRAPPSTVSDFWTTTRPSFPVTQQLYNVGYELDVARGTITTLPATAGPAWFPRSIHVVDDATAFRSAMVEAAAAARLPATIASSAWLLREDLGTNSVPATCADATVERARSDARGQSIEVQLRTTETCVLVVSTNYVSTLIAHARVGAELKRAPVVPVDVALAGIIVPPGATEIRLAPHVVQPSGPLVARGLGLLLLLGVVVVVTRRRTAP